ncbi:DUF3515 family protein [Solwaraspora sp. WMMD1047]|uniref:DUF3515 family protein n=1 Tax=Solwaraspora sp. WMMD1047 TaxID=3016102 RepID=UPI002417DBCA|nr:DUF3515 family protein [Solwaraspora sp. WMMD1047]MDG4829490.1 DUF3515 family protein [Solwaraspora sp. WMMD1047]
MTTLADPPTDDRPDRGTRQAALWATLVAVPLTLLVGALLFAQLSPGAPEDDEPDAPVAASTGPGSTAAVELPAPTLAERPAVVCRALLSKLPPTVRELAQRPVTAGAEQNAAYGDPALTVTCGGPPATAAPTDDVWTVNAVCWHAAPAAGAMVLTTVDREVPVQVTVPTVYEQPLQWLAPVSDAVLSAVPSASPSAIPSGCSPG